VDSHSRIAKNGILTSWIFTVENLNVERRHCRLGYFLAHPTVCSLFDVSPLLIIPGIPMKKCCNSYVINAVSLLVR